MCLFGAGWKEREQAYLEEVDPDEDGEDDFVGFAADAFVLLRGVRLA
jgi:hypothetical protein